MGRINLNWEPGEEEYRDKYDPSSPIISPEQISVFAPGNIYTIELESKYRPGTTYRAHAKCTHVTDSNHITIAWMYTLLDIDDRALYENDPIVIVGDRETLPENSLFDSSHVEEWTIEEDDGWDYAASSISVTGFYNVDLSKVFISQH